ncbi:SpoIIE family protein phosphatase [Actinopolymorpha sp. B17G11]|uniref:SpoIIE family protein phosphatase n=1 Tax=Actinopolymorpha sp. B17G11 TaxID=3160861 RepID=UPI0032E3A5D2
MTRPVERKPDAGVGNGQSGLHTRSDARFDALRDLVASGVVLVDFCGTITAVNAAAEAILHWKSEDLVGHDAIDIAVMPRYHLSARERLALIRTDGSWEGSVPLRRSNGDTLRCAVRARVVNQPTVHATGRATEEAAAVGGEVLVVFAPLASQPAGEAERAALLRAERAARSELEHVRDRLAFVASAGSRLASSLDVGMTYETVGALAVPRFGQLCVIDLWDGRRLDRAFVHDADADADPSRQSLVEEVRKLGGSQLEDHPGIRAALTARPVVVQATTPDVVASMYDDPHAQDVIVRTTKGQGLVTVPLITRGRVIGVLTLFGPGRAYGRKLGAGEDLPLIEQVATRAAQSIENARLFNAERRLARNLQESERRQRRAALTLQRSLLPAWPHHPGEVDVATRYFPGTEETEVGGDWYDVIPLSAGRTALVIGDVMGRGLRAATLMGQVRTAVRAYGRLDLPPKEILDLLDGIVADLGEAEIVTCIYAVFDRAQSNLTYASAGHLPLLVVDERGRARRLDHESGIPLGVGVCAAPEHAIAVPDDTVVAFYTDGLVEHRQRDVDAGIDQLVDALALATGTLEGMCDQVIDALRPPAGYDDDVALLLARAAHSDFA